MISVRDAKVNGRYISLPLQATCIMQITVTRNDGILVFVLDGRLDGHGAGILEDAIRSAFHDDDTAATVDMSSVGYLSSAGIRTLLTLAKEVKRRGGVMALVGVQEYPLKVLKMAGFQSIFSIVPTVEEAIRICGKGDVALSLIDELSLPSVTKDGVRYQTEVAEVAPAGLKVRGSLDTLLHARITQDDLKEASFSSIEYSFGLGALGPDAASALPILGEMITLHGTMIWLPTDGNDTPDFLAPAGDTMDIPVYTAFNVTLEGPFHEYVSFESDDPAGVSLADLYSQIISAARVRRRDFKGIIALVIAGVSAGVTGSSITRAPLKEYSGGLKGTIMEGDASGDWISTNEYPLYQGDTLVSFGVGVDMTADLSAYDPAALHALASTHPAKRGEQDLSLHNHGVIFKGKPWDRNADLGRQIQSLIDTGEVTDIRHLSDTTRLRRGKIGVAYIGAVVEE